jgi:hypothetical protein
MERSLRTGILCLLLLLVGVLYFSFLGSHGLLEPDEGRYSEIPREMLESGDWVTPRLNYVKYFEKPVLHYWLTALSFKLFGENAFASVSSRPFSLSPGWPSRPSSEPPASADGRVFCRGSSSARPSPISPWRTSTSST